MAMLLRSIRSLFRPRYQVQTGHTAWGPGLEVYRSFLGMRFRVGEDTFAKVASAYIDALPANWHLRQAPADRLTGGGALGSCHSVTSGNVARGGAGLAAPSARLARAGVRALPSLPPSATARRPESFVRGGAGAPRSPLRVDFHTVPSTNWRARCDRMAQLGEWAETPEVQAAAHLYNVRLRVFTPEVIRAPQTSGEPQAVAGSTRFVMRSLSNPQADGGTLDLVLQDAHYNWVPGGIKGDITTDRALAGRVRYVPGDGNCFFHCIAAGVPGIRRNHQQIRTDVVDYLRSRERMRIDCSDVGTLDDTVPPEQ